MTEWFTADGLQEPQPPAPRGGRSATGAGRSSAPSKVPPFDAAGLLRRARRNAQMSQREMAEAIGVGKSTIAEAERDGGSVTLPILLAALAVGGIELVAMDWGGEVEVMRPDALRDRRNRKLPAHLDAWVPSENARAPEHWKSSRHRNAPVRWALRPPGGWIEHLPLHHPGPEDIAMAARADADRRAFERARYEARYGRRRPRSVPPSECECSDECVELSMECPPRCPCQCDGTRRIAAGVPFVTWNRPGHDKSPANPSNDGALATPIGIS